MSQNDGTGTNWDETAPADDDLLYLGAQEIRDLRKGVGSRLSREHTPPAANGIGGSHSLGSARCYVGSAYPQFRPDGVTVLDANDNGRLYVDLNSGSMFAWYGAQWLGIRITDTNNLADSIIGTTKLADLSVTTGKIVDLAVTNAKIAAAAVDTGQLVDGSVTTVKIADGSVTNAKIAAASVDVSKVTFGLTVFTTGSYTGNGSASPGNAIVCGFAPDYVEVYEETTNAVCSAINTQVNPTRLRAVNVDLGTFDHSAGINFDASGFTILVNSPYCNENGVAYRYAAWKRSQ